LVDNPGSSAQAQTTEKAPLIGEVFLFAGGVIKPARTPALGVGFCAERPRALASDHARLLAPPFSPAGPQMAIPDGSSPMAVVSKHHRVCFRTLMSGSFHFPRFLGAYIVDGIIHLGDNVEAPQNVERL